MSLGSLNIGDIAQITGLSGLSLVEDQDGSSSQMNDSLRLLEMGFVPGSPVCVRHRAPLGGDPLVAEVNGVTIGLRLSDACLISVLRIREA